MDNPAMRIKANAVPADKINSWEIARYISIPCPYSLQHRDSMLLLDPFYIMQHETLEL
jgi:hypothetical protein